MQTILSFLGLAASGALGWFALEFVGRPIRSFFDLRKEVRQQLLFLANIQTELPKPFIMLEDRSRKTFDRMVEAKRIKGRTLRELGTKMLAFAEGEQLAEPVLRKLGYDPRSAGDALMGLSNNLEHGEARARFSIAIEKALRFEA
ncbi:hypothetical protein ABH999_006574 [Bradyrhizobium yuanmingense]|uniref:hypothetical protein n=1 Tax=Bradyrhizobium yuanmingense TaxID=108015 RepID=UPI0035182EC8